MSSIVHLSSTQLPTARAALQAKSTQKDRDNLKRFGITTDKFFGVSRANLKVLAKQFGRSHELVTAA